MPNKCQHNNKQLPITWPIEGRVRWPNAFHAIAIIKRSPAEPCIVKAQKRVGPCVHTFYLHVKNHVITCYRVLLALLLLLEQTDQTKSKLHIALCCNYICCCCCSLTACWLRGTQQCRDNLADALCSTKPTAAARSIG